MTAWSETVSGNKYFKFAKTARYTQQTYACSLTSKSMFLSVEQHTVII